MASRKEYIDKLESRLREWNAQIDAYQLKAKGKSEEIKTRFRKKNEVLKTRKADLRSKLDKMKDAGEARFKELRKDADKIWDDIKDGFTEMHSIIND